MSNLKALIPPLASALSGVDYSAGVTLFSGTVNTSTAEQNLTVPNNGIVVSYINNYTRYNGFRNNDNYTTIINFGTELNGSNSAIYAHYRKGDTVTVVLRSSQDASATVLFYPYICATTE